MIIPNKSYLSFNATLPDCRTYSDRVESNTVTTEILSYLDTKTIHSNKTSVKVGDSIQVTATITNHSSTKLIDNLFKIAPIKGAEFVV